MRCVKRGQARRHGVPETMLYDWKAKHGGLEISEAKLLQALENENSRLNRLLAGAMLDNADRTGLRSKNYNARR